MNFEKKPKVFEKRGFYLALCVCLIAVAALCWSTVDTEEKQIIPEVSSKPTVESIVDVAEVVSNIPNDKEQKVSKPEEISKPEASEPEASFFVLPVGGSVSKSFNAKTPQYSETYKDWRLHLGMDISAERGTAVFSSASGEVSKVYKDTMWGTIVEISHGGGITGIYCGLNAKPSVKIGDRIEAGHQIGSIDTIPCEVVEPAHLHFAMKKDGEWIDPMEYIG